MLLVDHAHEGGRRREDLVDKDEDGLLGRELYPLADDVDELRARCRRVSSERRKGRSARGRAGRTCPTVRSAGTRYFFLSMTGMSVLSAFSQITCTMKGRGSGVRPERARRARRERRTDGDAVRVLGADALCLGLALLCKRSSRYEISMLSGDKVLSSRGQATHQRRARP